MINTIQHEIVHRIAKDQPQSHICLEIAYKRYVFPDGRVEYITEYTLSIHNFNSIDVWQISGSDLDKLMKEYEDASDSCLW